MAVDVAQNDITLDGVRNILDGLLSPGMEFAIIAVEPNGTYRYTATLKNPRAAKALKAVLKRLEP